MLRKEDEEWRRSGEGGAEGRTSRVEVEEKWMRDGGGGEEGRRGVGYRVYVSEGALVNSHEIADAYLADEGRLR